MSKMSFPDAQEELDSINHWCQEEADRIDYIIRSIRLINEQQQRSANFEVDVLERLDALEKQMEALRKIVGRYAVTKQDKQELEASKKLWGGTNARRKKLG